jgi:hypothetical protein
MGYVTANHFRRGLACQRQQQKLKEQRTERVPSRLMYAIHQDIESPEPLEIDEKALRDTFYECFGDPDGETAPRDNDDLDLLDSFSAEEIRELMKQGLVKYCPWGVN